MYFHQANRQRALPTSAKRILGKSDTIFNNGMGRAYNLSLHSFESDGVSDCITNLSMIEWTKGEILKNKYIRIIQVFVSITVGWSSLSQPSQKLFPYSLQKPYQ